MKTATSLHDIRVEAPDGAAALELELRLAHLTPTTVSHRGEWVVEIPAAPDAGEVQAVVERWLDDSGIRSCRMQVDRFAHTVIGRRVRDGHRPSNAGFIG